MIRRDFSISVWQSEYHVQNHYGEVTWYNMEGNCPGGFIF